MQVPHFRARSCNNQTLPKCAIIPILICFQKISGIRALSKKRFRTLEQNIGILYFRIHPSNDARQGIVHPSNDARPISCRTSVWAASNIQQRSCFRFRHYGENMHFLFLLRRKVATLSATNWQGGNGRKCSTGLKLAHTPCRSCILTAEVPSRSKALK